MLLPRRSEIINYAPLQAASAALLGTSQPVPLNQTNPIEELQVTLLATVGTQLTFNVAKNTTAIIDNILGLLKQVTLLASDGKDPRSVVRVSGAGLLEYAAQVGLNLPRATLAAIILNQAATVAASLQFRIVYRIPLVHPMIGETLRTRCLFPAHRLPQKPVLQLDFANLADFTTAGTLTALIAEVRVIYRQMPDTVDAQIMATGGYIPMDLIETPFPINLGSAGPMDFDIPLGGQYTGLLLRTYQGNTTISRDVLDGTTTQGLETRWSLRQGNTSQEEFRFRNQQDINDYSRPANSATQSSSPNFAGAIAANTNFQPASSIYLDFLTDGLETATELGSLLDANTPANSGLKLQIHSENVAANVTVSHTLSMVGHRLFNDLSAFKIVKV